LWQPDVDSNQLDVLEIKMVEEIKKEMNINELRFVIFMVNDSYEVELQHFSGKWQPIKLGMYGNGKTYKTARLNAVLSYIKHNTKI
jgi:hypothetical protein